MTKEEIAQYILQWGENNDGPNKWNNNPIGKAIRKVVSKKGNWKEGAKWNPPRDHHKINMMKYNGEIPYKKDEKSSKNRENEDYF